MQTYNHSSLHSFPDSTLPSLRGIPNLVLPIAEMYEMPPPRKKSKPTQDEGVPGPPPVPSDDGNPSSWLMQYVNIPATAPKSSLT